MANTLRFKRGLVATIPTAVAGEPLFTTDTFDLYIGNGTTNTRFQKYIASGSTSQLLRGDGSLLTMPIVLTSPSNGQVLKYNGTNWVNDSDAGVTGSGTTNYLPKWTSGSALGNSLVYDNGTNVGIGMTSSAYKLDVNGSFRASSPVVTGDPNGYASFQPLYFAGAPNTPTTYFQVISNGNGSDFSQLGIGYNNRMYYRWGTNAWTELQSAISNPITGTGTTNYLPKFTGTSTIGNSNLINDASGNLGLGVTPSAWESTYKSYQLPVVSIYGRTDDNDRGGITSNAVFGASGFTYVNNGFATLYEFQNGRHQWYTAPSGTAGNAISFTQAMTLTAGGNLLLGTTTDVGQKLYVNGDVKVGTYLFMASEGSGSVLGDISTGNYLRFLVSNGERMRITSGGNVGIGTTSPQDKLTVKGPSDYNLNLGTLGGYSGIYVYNDASSAYKELRIDAAPLILQSFSGGNVGIGTTSPADKLDVSGSISIGAGGTNKIYNGSAADSAGLYFSSNQVNISGYSGIIFKSSTTNITSQTERMRIANDGNVGIGTTSPAAKLHLVDSVESEIRTQYSTTSSGKLITGNGFTTIGSITNDPLVFVSNNTERMRLTNGGNLLLGSTSDTGEKFQVTGAGIVSGLFTVSGSTGIPATTASNLRFASGFASPDIGRMYIGDGTGWKFHMSKRLSSTTTDLITFFDNGSVQTSAPTGYAAKPYKLGEVLDGAVTIPTKSVAVEIDGTVYFLLASTTLP